MSTTTWIVIGVVVVAIIIFFAYNASQRRKAEAQAEADRLRNLGNPNYNPTGAGQSNLAQILNSLFPFFNTYAEQGGFGN